ncbi:hypothetical protein FRC11_005074 [Ceratobasidium sp. 423]|nr:hypothetical protein FRC11_005074 [Ceratobasidium sp. 423]
MPADTKCKHTKSTCKCEGWESTKANKCNHKNKKIATKAHKTHCKEAKEDDLMEHEGKSSNVSQLCNKQAQLKPQKLIPEPEKLRLVDVELVHTHLDCLEEEHNLEWFQIWLENCVPKLKMFANWAAIFLLKECHNNIHNYKHDMNGSSDVPDSSSADHAPTSTFYSCDDLHADHLPADNDSQADEDASHVHKAAACKASL